MAPRRFSEIPFGVLWRKALVSIPRLVPHTILRYTNPDGPQPVVIHIPSRGRYEIPLYVFIPPSVYSASAAPSPPGLPILLDFHGGSFVLGSCPEQAPFCSKFAREASVLAISVDYRMGPYDTFPAALEDAEDVLAALLDPASPAYTPLRDRLNLAAAQSSPSAQSRHLHPLTLDTSRLALSGFSSGGNIALNLALNLPATPPYLPSPSPSLLPSPHPRRVPLLLFYPSFDARQLPSQRTRPKGLHPPPRWLAALNLEDVLMPSYLPRDLAAHPRASPGLNALQCLHPAAKVLLVLPELDSLAEQSEAWVEKVAEEGRGADLTVERLEGVKHGWTQFPDGWISEEARGLKRRVFEQAVAFVRDAWAEEVR